MTIIEYLNLNPDDYCRCADSGANIQIIDGIKCCKIWIIRPDYESVGCGKPLPPDFEHSLDVQQTVIEKMKKDWPLFKEFLLNLSDLTGDNECFSESPDEILSEIGKAVAATAAERYQAIMLTLEG